MACFACCAEVQPDDRKLTSRERGMKAMRHFTLDPQGAQIPVEFDEEQRQIWIARVRVTMIEATDFGGIRLQGQAQVRGTQAGQPWTELRTYIFSGAQFWKLVSDQLVDDPEQAGLFEAKRMMGGW